MMDIDDFILNFGGALLCYLKRRGNIFGGVAE